MVVWLLVRIPDRWLRRIGVTFEGQLLTPDRNVGHQFAAVPLRVKGGQWSKAANAAFKGDHAPSCYGNHIRDSPYCA